MGNTLPIGLCCNDRASSSLKIRPVDLLANGGLTCDFNLRRPDEEHPCRERYWEEFGAYTKRSSLRSIIEGWTERAERKLIASFVEIERHRQEQGDVVPPGYVSWDGGDVREVVRTLFEFHGLPLPACSLQVWTALWHRYDISARNLVDLHNATEFGRFFCAELCKLAHGDTKPVPIAPRVYLGGLQSSKEHWYKAYEQRLPELARVVDEWDPDAAASEHAPLFAEADADGSGALEWDRSEVKVFMRNVFDEHGVPLPALTDTQWRVLFQRFSPAWLERLSFEDSERFALFVHQEILRCGGDAEASRFPTSGDLSLADYGHGGVRLSGAGDGQFPDTPASGKNFSRGASSESIGESSLSLNTPPVVSVSSAVEMRKRQAEPFTDVGRHRQAVRDAMEAWDSAVARRIFDEVDRQENGDLAWNNSEAMCFAKEFFQRKSLPVPEVDERCWYNWYCEVDVRQGNNADLREAVEYVKHILERILHMNGVVPAVRPGVRRLGPDAHAPVRPGSRRTQEGQPWHYAPVYSR